MRPYLQLSCGALLVLILTGGCKTLETVTSIGADFSASAGLISQSQAEAAKQAAKPLASSFADITPEQEYYIGRTVGAVILGKYQPVDNAKANDYLNTLGQTLSQASDRPDTFSGYRFLLLDDAEVNAFAAPGGLIFVTRGMLACCPTEDALAAVLAHEIAHVQLKHGLRAIRTSRLTAAFTILAVEGTRSLVGEDLVSLTETFEESVGDITTTLVNNGYSSGLEKEADMAAVSILERVGYNPNALLQMLEAMDSRIKSGGGGFGSTHPSPQTRSKLLREAIQEPATATAAARQARFQKALKGV